MTKLVAQLIYAMTPLLMTISTGIVRADGPATSPAAFWTPSQPPRASYRIDCTVTMANDAVLQGRETIHFVNTTSLPMQTLAVTWFQVGHQTLTVTANGKPVDLPGPAKPFPQDFVLADPIRPGEPVALDIEFTVSIPVGAQSRDEGSLADWYPRLWWGCPSHDDYDVKLEMPQEYTIATSGRLDPGTGRYDAERASSFGIFLGREYQTLTKDAGDVSILCCYKPGSEKCAELLVDSAADVIGFYRDWLGFYPYRVLRIVPGMDRPAGGYPLATNIVVIHGMGRMDERPELHWRWIAAHEIGHQYWGMHVMDEDEETREFGWLWIGLGIYADREYCRARALGNSKHRELLARYIQGARQGLDTTVSRSLEEQSGIKFDFNNIVVHGKGFAIISALDCVLGKETFQRAYRRCLSDFAGRGMGLHEFRLVCERESGQDLGWFFDQWVNSNRHLSYEINSQKCEKQGDGYVTEVQVRCLGTLRMPVPVAAYFEDGTSQQVFTNRLRDVDTIRFRSRSALKEVHLDPEEALALIVPPPSPGAKEASEAVEAIPWVGAGEKAVDVFKKARDCNFADAGGWLKIGLTLYDGRYYKEALEAFETMESQAQGDSSLAFAAIVWQGHLFDLQGRREKAVERYKKALGLPSQPERRHDQYHIRLNRQWVEERLEEPFRRE